MGKQSESFTPYDSADYLTGIEDVAAYLEAAIEEAGDDPAFIAQALGTIARSSNNSELARRVGMSREGLYKAQRKGPLTSAFVGQRPFACIPTGYAWRLVSDASPGSRHQASHLRKRRSLSCQCRGRGMRREVPVAEHLAETDNPPLTCTFIVGRGLQRRQISTPSSFQRHVGTFAIRGLMSAPE